MAWTLTMRVAPECRRGREAIRGGLSESFSEDNTENLESLKEWVSVYSCLFEEYLLSSQEIKERHVLGICQRCTMLDVAQVEGSLKGSALTYAKRAQPYAAFGLLRVAWMSRV